MKMSYWSKSNSIFSENNQSNLENASHSAAVLSKLHVIFLQFIFTSVEYKNLFTLIISKVGIVLLVHFLSVFIGTPGPYYMCIVRSIVKAIQSSIFTAIQLCPA